MSRVAACPRWEAVIDKQKEPSQLEADGVRCMMTYIMFPENGQVKEM